MEDLFESAVKVPSANLELNWSLPDTSPKPSCFSSPSIGHYATISTNTVIKTPTSDLYDLPINL